jgi:hypothetical protein
MKERTTQVFLAVVGVLLLAHLFRPAPVLSSAPAGEAGTVPAVLRAQEIQLVNQQGLVLAQLYAGADGGGNLRLRSGEGTIRVKLGGTTDGSGLLLMDKEAEPAVWLATGKSGTSITLAEKGKEKRVLKP